MVCLASHGYGLAVREDIQHSVAQLNTNLEATAVPIKLALVSLYVAPSCQQGTECHRKLEDLVSQLPTLYVILDDLNAHHSS